MAISSSRLISYTLSLIYFKTWNSSYFLGFSLLEVQSRNLSMRKITITIIFTLNTSCLWCLSVVALYLTFVSLSLCLSSFCIAQIYTTMCTIAILRLGALSNHIIFNACFCGLICICMYVYYRKWRLSYCPTKKIVVYKLNSSKCKVSLFLGLSP